MRIHSFDCLDGLHFPAISPFYRRQCKKNNQINVISSSAIMWMNPY